MINKLVVGRFLDLPHFNQQPPVNPDAAFPTDFVCVPDRIYNIRESQTHGNIFTGRHKVSQVQAGAHALKGHRTFRWLPWLPGKVACMRLQGPEILTGRMTGCWLTTFTFNGQRYAGHVGTDSNSAENTQRAKDAWRNAMADYAITCHQAVKPTANDQLPPGNMGLAPNEGFELYGAWGQDGSVYSLILGAQPGGNAQRRRIASVVRTRPNMDIHEF
ncbi:MAG: hypothetical protein H6702_16225 [Myxococcales bacterium]|nr:hypothetical protein [Myxococcales bacterium]